MEFESDPPSDAGVVQGLAALRREGGSVLVVGAASGAQHDVCRRFTEGDDERIFVDTDGPVRNDEPADEVIERPFTTRSAATSDASGPTPGGITALAADVEAATRDHGETTETPRICVDSLRPFVDDTDIPTLVAALRSVGAAAEEAGAVAHFHLPAVPEAVPEPLFEAVDAVVEVRRRGGTTHQRWRFPGRTETTGWVRV